MPTACSREPTAYLCIVQMESQNQELADENSCLREEIERLRVTLDQHLGESASAKVGVIGA